jgi:two-component system, NtrC family, nitrogen regulation sensor histidine kinase NtrY
MGFSPRVSAQARTNPRKSKRVPYEQRIFRLAVLIVLPGLVASGILVWLQPWALENKLLFLFVEVFLCALIGAALHDQIIRPLQTLANVVGALREEDYSFRARLAVPDDALGELSLEVNTLADLLARNRTGALEASALVQRVMEEVEIPIFTFDPAQRLRLLNSAGEKLLQRDSTQLLGKTSSELGLEITLSCENQSLICLPFAGGARWFLRRSTFRQQGIPHTLVVLSDVSRALREEERQAWQRLIRVIGHELNNSLAPIKSISGSLNTRLSEADLDPELRRDFERGLQIIESRAASLNRFLDAYRRLAQMPPPVLRDCSLAELVGRVTALETRVAVRVVPGPDVVLTADPDQIEQMLINLLRNAAEAVLETQPSHAGPSNESSQIQNESVLKEPVLLTWRIVENELNLTIEDNGPGLMNPSNAFVPFYTTKSNGSGIGLVLSRQICEAHGGRLELSNRLTGRGCVVIVSLPMLHVAVANRG